MINPPPVYTKSKTPSSNDFVHAAYWYQKAANQGDAMSQYYLGLLYEYGQGLPQDYVAAYKWLALAHATAKPIDRSSTPYGSGAYELSDAAINKLKLKMTPEQIAQAQYEASMWYQQYHAK